MAYTFLRAKGIETGKSLVEADKIDLAKELLARRRRRTSPLELPVDHVVASGSRQHRMRRSRPSRERRPTAWDWTSVRRRCEQYSDIIRQAKTIVWNGPMGVFEKPKLCRRHFCRRPRGSGIECVFDRRRWRLRCRRRAVGRRVEDHAHFDRRRRIAGIFVGQKLPGVEVLTDKDECRDGANIRVTDSQN